MTTQKHLTARKRIAGTVATAVTGTFIVIAGVTSSAASFTDVEYVRGDGVGALACTGDGVLDTHAWGRVLSARLLGSSIDPILATDGVHVSNLAPAVSSSGTSTAGTAASLGNDAWSTPLELSVLSALDVGVGVMLPINTGTGVYTQYGRATSDGEMAGASGAVTTQAGGLVSLDTPTASTPRLGTLTLSTLLDSILLGLGQTVGTLADVEVEVGAVGSVAELDGCAAAWNPAAAASLLDRDYLVADLGLGLTSSLIGTAGVGIDAALASLQTSLNQALTAEVDASTVDAVTTLLTTALLGIASVDVPPDATQVTVSGTIDLDPVRALLTNDLSDGVVTVNLASGRLTADLAALVGEEYADSDGLNGRAANTSVLSPPVINALLTRVSALLTAFITNTLQTEIAKAINNTAISVRVIADLDATVSVLGIPVPVTVPEIIRVDTLVNGTIGGFIGAAGHPAPTASTSVTLLPGQSGLVLAALNTLLSGISGTIVAAVASGVVPSIGSTVVNPIVSELSSRVTTALATVVGTTVPPLITALGPALEVLATVLRLTINAQPDQPGSVGAPAVPAATRSFVSALHVGVLDGGTAVLDLWAASSSVGPYSVR